jgi:hypothetical protein
MVRVYINKDSENNITSINSEIFLSQDEMSTMTEIDNGQGDKYAHAQGLYLDKELVDKYGRYNYKYVNGKVVEVSEADKPTIEEPKAVPTEQEKINAQLMLQIAQLKAQLNGVK